MDNKEYQRLWKRGELPEISPITCCICDITFLPDSRRKRVCCGSKSCKAALQKIRSEKHHRTNYEKHKRRIKENSERERRENPLIPQLRSRKKYAIANGIPFDVTIEDLIVPEVCPVFNRPFIQGTRSCMSIDKIDNSKGYVKGSVQIISNFANTMKNSATKEELLMFADWIFKTYG